MELGDLVENALNQIGLNKGLVSHWLGKPCGCEERREKLNTLSRWAKMQARLGIELARKEFCVMIGGCSPKKSEESHDAPHQSSGPSVR